MVCSLPLVALLSLALSFNDPSGNRMESLDLGHGMGVFAEHDGCVITALRTAQLRITTPATRVLRGPYLQRGTASSMIIRWRTDVAEQTRVWLGPSPNTLRSKYRTNVSVTDHSAELKNLRANTRYYYAIGDSNGILVGADQDHWFRTSPVRGVQQPVRIWVIGDSGARGAKLRAVRDAYLMYRGAQQTDVWLALGDNAYSSGTDTEYQLALFDQHSPFLRNHVLWSTFGNHDGQSASSVTQTGPYYDIFDLPTKAEAGGIASGTEAYYSFDYANIHFVCLDSSDSDRSKTGTMALWVQKDLAASKAEWNIAFWHHAPYTKGTHDSDIEPILVQMRQDIVPILETAGVDLVLSGHSHGYERSFLLDRHYGMSTSLAMSMVLDRGDGSQAGDGIYAKRHSGLTPHAGTVYVVAGNASIAKPAPLDHPAMIRSLAEVGSLVIDVDGRKLECKMLNGQGQIRDTFVIVKGLQRRLNRVEPRISLASGGKQELRLDVGSAFDKHVAIVLSSATTLPGFDLHGVHVPLGLDPWFRASIELANSSTYQNSLSVLGATGRATTTLRILSVSAPNLVGVRVYHSVLVFDTALRLKQATRVVHVTFTN